MSAIMLTAVSCNSRQDSTETAEKQNDERFENSEGADDDAEFAVEAADGGLLEVQLGTLAKSKATSPQVKAYAEMIVDQHSKANGELKSLAQQKNISLPNAMSNEHQRKYDNLAEKTGEEFDKEYMDLMVKDHKEDIDEFEEHAKQGNDPQLKEWASSKLPTLRQHLEEAERVQEALDERDRG